MVDLRTPHEDWDLYLGALSDLKEPIEDERTYRSKLEAFIADIDQIARTPMISGHALNEAMVKVIGHTYEPCASAASSRRTAMDSARER